MPDLNALIRVLNHAGFLAFPEFAGCLNPLPNKGCFVTLAAACSNGDAPLRTGSGFVIPLICQLRVRVHAGVRQDIRALAEEVQAILLTQLAAEHCNVHAVQRGEIRYGKPDDRLSIEYQITVKGLLICTQGEDLHADFN